MKRTLTIVATLALLTQSIAVAQDTAGRSLTLQEALRLALANNTTAARQRSEVEFNRAQSRLIRTSILPSIDLYASSTFNSSAVKFGSDADAFEIVPKQDWNYRLALTQPLYAGGREFKAYRQSKLFIEDAREGSRGTDQQVLLQTASDYLGVVEGEALLAVERKNLELAERRRKEATNFYQAGEVTKVDVLRAETAVKAGQRRVAAASQLRESAESRLRIDLAVDHSIDVTTTELSFPQLPEESALVTSAVASRPEARRADIMREIASLEVRKQRGRYLPTVMAEASVSGQKVDFPADQGKALTLNFAVPIFQSGEIEAQIASARVRQKQAEIAQGEVQRQVREAVQLSMIDLRTTGTNLSLAREQLAAAEAEYEQTFELYRAQEATSLDLDASESALGEARRAVATGKIDRDLAELRVWYAAGSISNVLTNEGSK